MIDSLAVRSIVVIANVSEAIHATSSSLRANGSHECAPDDRLREAISSIVVIASVAKQSIVPKIPKLDCFVAHAPVRKRIAFVAGKDG